MYQALVFEVDVLANTLAVEPHEQRRRAGAIETFIVIEDLDPHKPFPLRQSRPV